MKRFIGVLALICAIGACLMVGCSGSSGSASNQPSDAGSSPAVAASSAQGESYSIVCTTFPAYDWVRAIVGDQADRFDITYLLGSGADLHSYQPSVEDIASISDCDLFVYVGGESDEWVADALAQATNPNQHSLSLLEAVGGAAVEEEVVEGMESDHDDDHDGEHADGDEADHEAEHEEEGPEYDEHVWLSVKNAQTLVNALAAELEAIDADNAATYAENAEAYNAELAELDERYAQAVAAGAHDTVVFADRFPFRYLVDDYGLNYYAAFVGCSAETEASFETVAFLAQKVDELGLDAVLVIEGSDQKIAETVIETTQNKNQTILVMDSLQSVTLADVENGKTYLDAMTSNLDVLTAALG